jgi:hypothetical protein
MTVHRKTPMPKTAIKKTVQGAYGSTKTKTYQKPMIGKTTTAGRNLTKKRAVISKLKKLGKTPLGFAAGERLTQRAKTAAKIAEKSFKTGEVLSRTGFASALLRNPLAKKIPYVGTALTALSIGQKVAKIVKAKKAMVPMKGSKNYKAPKVSTKKKSNLRNTAGTKLTKAEYRGHDYGID